MVRKERHRLGVPFASLYPGRLWRLGRDSTLPALFLRAGQEYETRLSKTLVSKFGIQRAKVEAHAQALRITDSCVIKVGRVMKVVGKVNPGGCSHVPSALVCKEHAWGCWLGCCLVRVLVVTSAAGHWSQAP